MNILDFLFAPTGAMGGAAGFGTTPPHSTARPRKPKGTSFTRVLISLAVTLVIGAVYFYIELPALNIHNGGFYWFVILLSAVFAVCMVLLQGFRANTVQEYFDYGRKKLLIPLCVAAVAVLVSVIGTAFGFELLRADDYANLISVESGDFASEVAEINWTQIPMLDEGSSNNLANRKLGELSDLVSQFTVSSSSAQINYKGNPMRVNYLNYGGFFKWWNNRSEGIPAYMTIDMCTQEVNVVKLEDGIKYSPSEYFNRNLMRHLRFSYPTLMYEDVNFEIDDDGVPYWVASVIDKTIGLFNGTDVKGAVLMNAVTGETAYYDVKDVPTWVDRVYSADLLIEQYNYYGKYIKGFWNSLFGQTSCTTTTTGYNYIAQDDDVWMYTGITSVTGDRGNIGFILVNQRTKESRYYSCAGAEEYSAMSSAQGAVQQYQYSATFPLLLNISDQPTYFMALKDDAELVKMYAMVNVQQYQIVATGYNLAECQQNYHELMLKNNIVTEEEIVEEVLPQPDYTYTEGVIAEIRQVNIDGNTIFYLRLDGGSVYYTVSAKLYPITAIIDVGDSVKLSYEPSNEPLLSVQSLEYTKAVHDTEIS